MLDYPPPYRGQVFQFPTTRHFFKAPTSSYHQDFILSYFFTAAQRCGGSKCAQLFALVQWHTVSVTCK